jgi:two-component system, sensor histidine kinase and response regulator
MNAQERLDRRYQDLVYNSPHLIAIQNTDGVFSFVSPSSAALIGYLPQDLVGASLFDFAHLQDHENLRRTFGALKQHKTEQTVDYRLRHRSGSYVWFRTIYHPVVDSAGQAITAFHAYSINIMQDKKIEAALQVLSQHDHLLDSSDWFRILVSHLTSVLKVKYAFITTVEENRDRVRMLAFWKGTDFADPYSYPLVNTPCDAVIREGKMCYYPLSIQTIFPNDKDLSDLNAQGYLGLPIYGLQRQIIGHIAILDSKPLKISDSESWLAKLFVIRAGIELERIRVTQ